MYNSFGKYWSAWLMSLVCLLSACSDFAVEPQSLPDDAASLEKLLKTSESPEEQMEIYYKLSFVYEKSDPDLAKHYLEKQLSLAEQEGDVFYEAKARSGVAIFLRRDGQLKLALNNYLEAINLYGKLGEEARQADDLNNVGFLFMHAKGFQEAIPYFSKAAAIYQKAGDQRYEIISRTNLAICYSAPSVNRMADAQQELTEAISIQKEMDISNESRLAYLYNELGRIYFMDKQYAEALEQYSAALSYEKDMDNVTKSDIYHNMAEVYLYKENLSEARNWLDVAHNLSNADVDNSRLMVRRLNIETELYQKEGNYASALATSRKAIEISDKDMVNEPLQGAVALAIVSEKMMSKAGAKISNGEIFALTDLQARQNELRDEFNTIDKKPLLSVLAGEANEYHAKIQALENNAYNRLITGVASGVVFILLSVIAFIIFNERIKKLILKSKADYCIDLVENWDKHMGKRKY